MLRQAFCAALKAGDNPAAAGTACRIPTDPGVVVTCGSGNAGTPCALMHRAYANACSAGVFED